MAVSKESRASSSSSEVERGREALTQEIFDSFFLGRRNVVDTFFRSGYLFDPYLFGSFMDPCDAFPLWSYTPYSIWPEETVSLSKSRVDWFKTEESIILCADLPGMKKHDINVTVENGQILKISGVWNHKIEEIQESAESGEWWRVEFMRRFVLPENANIEHARARIDDGVLDVRIPRFTTKPAKELAPPLKVVEVTDK